MGERSPVVKARGRSLRWAPPVRSWPGAPASWARGPPLQNLACTPRSRCGGLQAGRHVCSHFRSHLPPQEQESNNTGVGMAFSKRVRRTRLSGGLGWLRGWRAGDARQSMVHVEWASGIVRNRTTATIVYGVPHKRSAQPFSSTTTSSMLCNMHILLVNPSSVTDAG